MLRKLLFILTVLLQVLPNANAQDFSASVSKQIVANGERFRLTYLVKNRPVESLTPPRFSDFSVVGGPYQSSSTQIINGQMSSSVSVSYDLVGNKPGSYIIGGAVLKSGGKNYTSNEVQVEVTKDQAPQTQQNRQNQNPFGQPEPQQQPARTAGDKNDLFVITSLSKNSAYPGEAITVTYKIYTRFPQIQIEEIKFPEYKDAWVNELKESGDKSFSRENYNGQAYNVAVLQRTLFTPQRAGEIAVKPVTARVFVQYQERSGNFWEDFFGGARTRQERREVTGNPVTLKVKDYPTASRPEEFSGATGDFKMEVSTDRNSLPVNDALTLKIKISGKGNFTLLDVPKLNLPDVFESYDPKVSEKISAKSDGVSGSKTFEIVLIPRIPGNFQIPPVRFSFFDPISASYKTLASDTFTIQVTGDAAGGMVYNPGSGGKTESLAEDIRYLKTDYKPSFRFIFAFPGVGFWVIFVFSLIGTGILWIFRTRIWDFRKDGERRILKQAESVAVKRFKKAETLLRSGNTGAFYQECYHALGQYLRDRFRIPLSEISSARIRQVLANQGFPTDLVAEASSLLDTCEMARFAPGGTVSELSDFHKRCIQLITQMDKKV